jgi:hypothetical protein
MSSGPYELNINNYTVDELVDMFSLPQDFDQNLIEIKETQLRNQISKNTSLTRKKREDTLNFISKAKNVLTRFFQETHQKINTTELTKLTYNIHDGTLPKTDTIVQGSHMIQESKDIPYANSFPGEFYPGVVNPLKKKTSRINLNIDTRFRENYFGTVSTNFNFQLPLNLNNILSLQLSAIEIPLNFYVVSKAAGNNFFNIRVDNEQATIVLPDGNYTVEGVIRYINTALTNLGAPFSGILFQQNLYNGSGSDQILVGVNATYGGVITSISLDFQASELGGQDRNTPLPLKFGWMLGFRNGFYENSLSYVSEGIPDFSGPKYIFLVVDDFNNNVNNGFYSAFNSSILNNNILARISLQGKGATFVTLTENNSNIITYPRQYYGPVNIYNMAIQILDEYGRVLNLNNTDYSFCLTMQMIYDLQ